tara:strand:+ start:51 stop:1997 length:1947 start_codon:yes stop_codon:yes gene_type:complete
MFGAEAFPKINTGTDLVTSSSNMLLNTGGSATVQPMSPMDTMREVFFDIRDSLQTIVENTLETNELLRVGVLGTPAERRDEAIEDAETDKERNELKDESTGPSFLDRVKGLNPFQSGLGAFGKALLALAGLLGLKAFSPQIQKGLADVLTVVSDGELTDKIEEVYELAETKVVDTFKDLKEGMKRFLIGVQAVVDTVADLYTRLEDFTEGFDMEATLEKLKPIMEEIKENTIKAIGNFAKEALLAIGGAIIGATFLKQTLAMALANPALKTIFSGKILSNAAATKAALRAGTLVPLAGLLLYGITTTWSNMTNSIARTIEEEGEFKFGSFLANFFGGSAEGGWLNALKQAFKIGGPFALAGIAVGMAVTSFTGPGMLVGALVGGIIGTAVGAVIGAFTGYLGSDKLKEFGSALKETIDSAIDYIKNFFKNLINNIKRLVGAQTDPNLDLAKAEKDVEDAKEKLATNPDYAPFINDLAKKEKILEVELEQQPLKQAEAFTGFSLESIDKNIQQETDNISLLQNQKSLLTPATNFKDFNSGLTKSQEIDLQIKEANDRINILNSQRNELNSYIPVNTSGLIDNFDIQNRIKKEETNMAGAGSSGNVGNVVQQNIDNSTALRNDNHYIAAMTADNAYSTAVNLTNANALKG